MGFFRKQYKRYKRFKGKASLWHNLKKSSRDKSRDARRKRLTAAELALTQQRGDISSGFGAAEGSLYEAMGVLGKAYDTARGDVSAAGARTKQRINYQAGESYAQGAADLTKQGFGDANILKQYRRGVLEQSNRSIGAVDEGFASLHAELLRRKGVGLGEAQSRISRLRVERTKALLGASKSQYNLAVGLDLPEYQPSQVDLGGLTSFIGSLGAGSGGGN